MGIASDILVFQFILVNVSVQFVGHISFVIVLGNFSIAVFGTTVFVQSFQFSLYSVLVFHLLEGYGLDISVIEETESREEREPTEMTPFSSKISFPVSLSFLIFEADTEMFNTNLM